MCVTFHLSAYLTEPRLVTILRESVKTRHSSTRLTELRNEKSQNLRFRMSRESPRGSRGGAATHVHGLSTWRPRRRRDPSSVRAAKVQ